MNKRIWVETLYSDDSRETESFANREVAERVVNQRNSDTDDGFGRYAVSAQIVGKG